MRLQIPDLARTDGDRAILQNWGTSHALKYDEVTNHSEISVRMSPHYLDWENKPAPFKAYTKLNHAPLPGIFRILNRKRLKHLAILSLKLSAGHWIWLRSQRYSFFAAKWSIDGEKGERGFAVSRFSDWKSLRFFIPETIEQRSPRGTDNRNERIARKYRWHSFRRWDLLCICRSKRHVNFPQCAWATLSSTDQRMESNAT